MNKYDEIGPYDIMHMSKWKIHQYMGEYLYGLNKWIAHTRKDLQINPSNNFDKPCRKGMLGLTASTVPPPQPQTVNDNKTVEQLTHKTIMAIILTIMI